MTGADGGPARHGDPRPSDRLRRDFLTGLPERFGAYRVERELARGGMGVVLVARHAALDRAAAVKVMQGVSGHALERFQREARATARLRHPNIVAVHAFGEEAGVPYLVMDLIEGQSLSDAVAEEGPLPDERAAALTATLADALACAHRQGVLHRDIKPANVLLDSTGAPLLTDFGLAKVKVEEGQSLTKTGAAVGTPAYMAPEQARGAKDRIDARVDVYALGATLYFMLTGHKPFEGDSALNLIVAVLHQKPPRPRNLRPGVDPALEAICLRCLEKRPEDRFPSAAALAEALEAWAAERQGAAGGAQGGRGWLAAAVVGCALGLGGGVVFAPALVGASAGSPAPTTAAEQPRGPDPGPRGSASTEHDAWERWRRAPDDVAPLAAVVEERLRAGDAVGLSRLWSEVHRVAAAPGDDRPVQATERDDLAAAVDRLRQGDAPLATRLRAALAAARLPDPEAVAALRGAAEAGPPILTEAALAGLLAQGELPLADWCDRPRPDAAGVDALRAVTLLERAPSLREDDRAALGTLATRGGPLVRAALPLAVALSASLDGGLPAPAARRVLQGLEGDPDPRVGAEVDAADGVVAALEGQPGGLLDPTTFPLARVLVQEPGARRDLRAAWAEALAASLKGEAPPVAHRMAAAWTALERGDLAEAEAQAARVLDAEPGHLGALEVHAQSELLVGGGAVAPDLPPGGDPVARQEAARRLAFVARFRLPAAPAPNGALRAAAPLVVGGLPAGVERGVLVRRRAGSHNENFVYGETLHLRTRFGFSDWQGLIVDGHVNKGLARFWFDTEAETGLQDGLGLQLAERNRERFFHWVDGDVVQEQAVSGEELREGVAIGLDRCGLRVFGADRRLGSAGAWPRRRPGQGRGLIKIDGAALTRAVWIGRWDGHPGDPPAPTDEDLAAWQVRLAPLPGDLPLRAERVRGPARLLAELRERGQRIAARGVWVGGVDQPRRLCVGGLRGDLELRARVVFDPGTKSSGVQAGLTIRDSSGRGDNVRVYVANEGVRLAYQRREKWDNVIAFARLPKGEVSTLLVLRRVGDTVVGLYGPALDDLQPLVEEPLRMTFSGPVDAGLYASEYGRARKVERRATFSEVELSAPR